MAQYLPWVTFTSGGEKQVIKLDDEPYASNLLSYGDNSTNVELLVVLWASLLADSPVDSSTKPVRLYRGFIRALTEDFLGTTKSYASLYDRLTTSCKLTESGVTIDYFIDEFKGTPVFREYLAFYKTHDPKIFQYLSSFLVFGKKAYYEDPSFDVTAFRGWSEVEERLAGLTFDTTDHILEDLREILAWVLRDFNDDVVLPKHGSGAVAEPGARTVAEKNNLLICDDIIAQLFNRPDQVIGLDPHEFRGQSEMAKHRVSRLKFVPKDIGKSRSICMESSTLQWAQQGVRLWVEQALAATLGDHIPLHDQERNRELARYGSRSGTVDTIDLSSASDSVHMDLIRSIMPSSLLPYLEATRSKMVLFGESELIEVKKFAPMGSALCFPIQSLVYAAFVLYSSLRWRFGMTADLRDKLGVKADGMQMLYNITYTPAARYRLEPFSIYGDDIICDTRITTTLIELLTRFGFTVNVSKSFTGDSAFRESCGGYYLNGVDVTPIRAKFGKVSRTLPMSTLAALIGLANRARAYGYFSLRKHLINICLYFPITGRVNREHLPVKNEILFTSDPNESLAILTDNPSNKHLKKRVYSPKLVRDDSSYHLQRDEVRSLTIGPDRTEYLSEEHDWYRHTVWWRSRLHSDDIVVTQQKIPTHVGPAWRWTSQ